MGVRVLACGDLHFTEKAPELRTDDYQQTLMDKLSFIWDVYEENNCDFVVFPGDIFDTSRPPYRVTRRLMEIFSEFPKVLCVAGQHDQRYHNPELENTPLGILEASNKVEILSSYPINYSVPTVSFYGASWGEEIPLIVSPEHFNVLVTHRMCVLDEKIWEDQDEFEWANHLLLQTKFDLILTGDNHRGFTSETKDGRVLINAGSVMRSRIDQIDHNPTVYVIECSHEPPLYEAFPIPIKPPEKVVDLKTAELKREKTDRMKLFSKKIAEETRIKGLDFPIAIQREATQNTSVQTRTSNILMEIYNEWKEHKTL